MKFFLTLFFIPLILFSQDHLLITEVLIPQPGNESQAFVEIYNPAPAAVSLENYYLADYNTYYEIVNSTYNSTDKDFIVRFPADSVINSKENLTVALDGSGFESAFGKQADYEIIANSGAADMNTFQSNDNAKIESQEIVILFYWDGQTDLVQDVDYVNWSVFTNNRIDKSGVAIDGPDAGSETTQYADETAAASQSYLTAPGDGNSFQRSGVTESNETSSAGNGITGHDETSENWTESFSVGSPAPGFFAENPGDGSGTAEVSPTEVDPSTQTDLTFTMTGTAAYPLASVMVIVPSSWTWSQSASDVQISGDGFTGASVSLNGNEILVENAQVTDTQTAELIIKNATAPSESELSTFIVKTAVEGGSLTDIASHPTVNVQSVLTIKDIQENQSFYQGKTVTVTAVVSIGAGITTTTWTDAYIQDESGWGINIYKSGEVDANFVRGNLIKVTGVVDEYSGTTEIVDYSVEVLSSGNDVPNIAIMSTAQAGNLSREGSMIQTAGIINDKAAGIGGGTNITINDGSGDIQLRIWDSAGLNLDGFNVGDTIGVHAVIDQYESSPQLLAAYQEDIYKTELTISADGSGTVTVEPSEVDTSQTIELAFNFTATSEDTVAEVSITIPSYWEWTGSGVDVGGSGAFGEAVTVINGNTITLTNAALTESNSGQVTISNLNTPDVDTASVFIIKTASAGGGLTEIENSPVILVGEGTGVATISIAEARELKPGDKISIKGVITIGAGVIRTNFTDAYIQDESGCGINIYRTGNLDADIKRGNLVVMEGELDEYDGKLEIVDYTTTILKTNAELLGVQKITTYEASTTFYEGSFIEVQGAIKSMESKGGGVNLDIDDGSGTVTLRIWDTANLDLSGFEAGDFVIANGVISVYNNAGQVLLGYQEDIYKPSFDGNPVILKVENKPFVPDRGERIKIEYSGGGENTHITLRIFDLGGRLVTTLFDGAGVPCLITVDGDGWDGRDQLNELVPLGVYICHLDVVNKDTGKRTQKTAPIVVGTVLR